MFIQVESGSTWQPDHVAERESKNETVYDLRTGKCGLGLLREGTYRISWANYSGRRLDFLEFQKVEISVTPALAASWKHLSIHPFAHSFDHPLNHP